MRAITLTQPWAGLVAAGLKLVENRPMRMIKPENVGRRVVIHASREIDESVYRIIEDIDPELTQDMDWYRLSRVTSAFIGVVSIDTCIVKTGEDDGGWDYAPGWPRSRNRSDGMISLDVLRYFFGPIGYVLRPDAVVLPRPIAAKGKLGHWRLTDAQEHDVVESLELVAA